MSTIQGTLELDVRDNALESLELVSKLPRLTSLYAGRNILSTFNPNLMAFLEVLDLSDNRLEGISLEGLTALRFLNLAGNPFSLLVRGPFESWSIVHCWILFPCRV